MRDSPVGSVQAREDVMRANVRRANLAHVHPRPNGARSGAAGSPPETALTAGTLTGETRERETRADRSHPSGAPAFESHANILGVRVSAVDMDRATSTLETWIREGTPNYVCVTGVHGVMESWRDPALRRVHNAAGMVTPDGMPLVWMAQRMGFSSVRRVYGPDLMRAMTEISAQKGYRNYYYGGRPGTPERLHAALRRQYPGLVCAGTYSPPFGPVSAAEDDEIVRRINAARPDIVWVGLSTPLQERWMAAHVHRLTAPVLAGVGAAFDFLAGDKPQAPVWMQRRGLEWLFRMASEPRRLAGRYARNNPAFAYHAMRQLLARRDFAGLDSESTAE